METEHRIAFGPIPSRRLGRSLGVNTIPAKSCSYDCRYCQVGPTTEHRIEPRAFFGPDEVTAAVSAHLALLRSRGQGADYLTFVPDGEPTLDLHLGDSIDALEPLRIPVAVISNASLLWRPEIRARLARADLVSVKVDSAAEQVWRAVNRPHPALRLAEVLDGIAAFAAQYRGRLISETMLVAGINDTAASLRATAAFLARIRPATAYLAVPTRPTNVGGVHGPSPEGLRRAREVFEGALPAVDVLSGPEPAPFATTGDAVADLLAITAVHAMRESAVRELLRADGAGWEVVEDLLADGRLRDAQHEGERFFLRRHGGPSPAP